MKNVTCKDVKLVKAKRWYVRFYFRKSEGLRIYYKNDFEWELISENEEHSPQMLLQVEVVREL